MHGYVFVYIRDRGNRERENGREMSREGKMHWGGKKKKREKKTRRDRNPKNKTREKT
jgi:hypothetical protein